MSIQNYKCFKTTFLLYAKGSISKLPKDAPPLTLPMQFIHVGDCDRGEINGKDSPIQSTLKWRYGENNNLKKASPSLPISTTKTGKARVIRRYWQYRENNKQLKSKQYTTLWISLPDLPGQLGDVTSLIGQNKMNISSVKWSKKRRILLILDLI